MRERKRKICRILSRIVIFIFKRNDGCLGTFSFLVFNISFLLNLARTMTILDSFILENFEKNAVLDKISLDTLKPKYLFQLK